MTVLTGGATRLAAACLAFALSSAAWGGETLWGKHCDKTADGKTEVCTVQQFVTAQPGNRQLLLADFGYTGPKGNVRLVLVAPLGVALPSGLSLGVDSGKPITVPFEICDAGGCRSIIDMDGKALDQFLNGKVLTVRLAIGGRTLDLPVKLEGLTAALKTIAP